jgi:hypothetical protein
MAKYKCLGCDTISSFTCDVEETEAWCSETKQYEPQLRERREQLSLYQ